MQQLGRINRLQYKQHFASAEKVSHTLLPSNKNTFTHPCGLTQTRKILFQNFLPFLFLFLISFSLSGQNRDTGQQIIRADTIFEQRVIDGKQVTVRRIRIYDTVYIMRKMTSRPFQLNKQQNTLPAPKLFPAPKFRQSLSHFGLEAGVAMQIWEKSPYQAPVSFPTELYPTINHSKAKSVITPGIFGNVSYCKNNWYVKSGLQLHYFSEQHQLETQRTITDSTIYEQPTSYDSIIIDTAYYVDPDQWPDDTVYIMNIDTFVKTVYDTIRHTDYDTTHIKNKYKLTNRYFYLELPILVGRTFAVGPLEIELEGGFYAGWLARVQLRMYDTDNSIRQLNNKYAHKFSIDVGAALRIKIPIDKKKYIAVQSGIRHGLWNIYTNEALNTEKITRINIGISYIFQ